MTSLSNIYIRIDLELSDNEKVAAQYHLHNLAKVQSKILFEQNVDVKIELLDGSLEIYITIVGSLCAAIAGYIPLKKGIQEIIKDSKLFYTIIISRLYKNGIKKEQILKTRKNSGVVSKINRLLNRIEKAQKFHFRTQKEQTEIKNIINYTDRIFHELSGDGDKKLFFDLLHEVDNEERIYKQYFKMLQSNIALNGKALESISFNKKNREFFDFGETINRPTLFHNDELITGGNSQKIFGVETNHKTSLLSNLTKKITYNKDE